MPEERNRIAGRPAFGPALLPRRALGRAARVGRRPRSERGRRRRDGRRDAPLRADRARAPAAARAAVRRADDPPGGEHGAGAASRDRRRRSHESGRPFVFPVHPRTRHALDEHGIELPPNVEAIEPLGYLEMLALVADAAAVVTDSGGLQKEAYWLRVPCVTVRPSHGVGRHGRTSARTASSSPDEIADALGRRRFPDDAPELYGDGHAAGTRRSRAVPLTAVPEESLYDVAVIGAGYVGVPLAVTFGEAGNRVLLVDVQTHVVDALNRGESHIEDVSVGAPHGAHREGAHHRDDRLRARQAGARDPDRAADAALAPARARPLLHRARRAQPRAGPPARAGRHPRVDDLAGHDPRDPAADPRRGLGPEGRRGLPPRDVARARRPGPRGLDDEDDAEGRRRDQRRVDEGRGRGLPQRRSTRCTRCRRPRPPS